MAGYCGMGHACLDQNICSHMCPVSWCKALGELILLLSCAQLIRWWEVGADSCIMFVTHPCTVLPLIIHSAWYQYSAMTLLIPLGRGPAVPPGSCGCPLHTSCQLHQSISSSSVHNLKLLTSCCLFMEPVVKTGASGRPLHTTCQLLGLTSQCIQPDPAGHPLADSRR